MSKKNHKSLCASDIYSGNIITLYNDQGVDCGKVRLIEEQKGIYDSYLPYVKWEVGGTDKQDAHVIIWNKVRWKVEFLADGFITARYVHYFIEEIENEENSI